LPILGAFWPFEGRKGALGDPKPRFFTLYV
jgi:hypothetical protein